GGKNWSNVTKNLPDLPEWVTVDNIEASRYDAGTAYLTVDGHQVNVRDPFVYKTTDYGKTWTLITDRIPHNMLSYAHCVREDPVRKGLLYLGTEGGLYVSFDDGKNWQPLQSGLPHAPVYWLTVQERFHDLAVATYGRGFWILDDITALEQFTPEVGAAKAHLFAPREAYRFKEVSQPPAMSRLAVLAAPGTYTVTLILGEAKFTQKLTVLKDPHTAGSESDIQAQTRVQTALYDEMNAMSATANQIESLRAQLVALRKELGTDDASKALQKAADDIGEKLAGIEGTLLQLKLTGRGQDDCRWAPMLLQKVLYLF